MTRPYRQVLVLRLKQQSGGRRKVVILQGGLVVVGDGQRVARLDEEVIVESSMFVIMHQCRPVRGNLKQASRLMAMHDNIMMRHYDAQVHSSGDASCLSPCMMAVQAYPPLLSTRQWQCNAHEDSRTRRCNFSA